MFQTSKLKEAVGRLSLSMLLDIGRSSRPLASVLFLIRKQTSWVGFKAMKVFVWHEERLYEILNSHLFQDLRVPLKQQSSLFISNCRAPLPKDNNLFMVSHNLSVIGESLYNYSNFYSCL